MGQAPVLRPWARPGRQPKSSDVAPGSRVAASLAALVNDEIGYWSLPDFDLTFFRCTRMLTGAGARPDRRDRAMAAKVTTRRPSRFSEVFEDVKSGTARFKKK